jgi:hypothetical protein
MMDWSQIIDEYEVTLLKLLRTFSGVLDDDARLPRALDAAGPAVETYLDRAVAQREVTEHWPGHFGTVVLSNWPVADPVVVTLNGTPDASYSTFMGRGTAYLSRIGQSRDTPIDWRPFDQVTVVYVAGWAKLPSDLAQAVVYVASGLHQSEGTGQVPSTTGDVSRMSIQDVGAIAYTTTDDGLAGWGVIPGTAHEMLVRYQRRAT